MIVWIGLGANLGDRRRTLQRACGALDGAFLKLLACSALYASPPMGPADQPNFLNAAVCVASALGLGSLLQHVKAVERTLGRVERERWREREVDLDLLAAVEDGPFRGLALEPALEVPHNGLWNRPFVLAPLMDLRDLMPGDLRSSVEEAWGRQAACGGRPVWRVEEAGWFRNN